MHYWFPTIPSTPIDIVNRRAAATGSVNYAMATAYADYNGHYVTVSYKAHAMGGPRWNAEYYWGERVVLGRGSFEHCLRAAKYEYDRGAHGCVVHVCLAPDAREPIDEQQSLCEQLGAVPWSKDIEKAHTETWYTGTHHAITDALLWEKFGFSCVMQAALRFTGKAEEWPQVREAVLEKRRSA